jgi:phosphohistidine phosphatase
MNILIVRHGEAHAHANSDFQRELTTKGKRDASSAGRSLGNQNLSTNPMSFDRVWVSPYQRAQQTADFFLRAANLESVPRDASEIITPDCSPADVVAAIFEAKISNLILISHQPLVSALIGTLVSSQEFSGPAMSPGSMALLETDTVLAGCCTLKWLSHAPNYERCL